MAKKHTRCIICNYALFACQHQYCFECAAQVRGLQNRAMYRLRLSGIPPATQFKCKDCGKPAKHYDHRYYGLPLKVDAVCQSCNQKRGPAKDVKRLVPELCT